MHPDSREIPFRSPSELRLDQSNRWRRGERAPVEQFLEEFPELSQDPQAVFDLIRSELSLRAELGEHISLDEYLERFPAHSKALQEMWAGLEETQTRVSPQNVDIHQSPTIAVEAVKPSYLRTLPGLELFEKLGEGAVGVVYRARDLRLNQPRAIKVIRSGPFAGKDAQERFGREARAAARLDHPGLVRVHSLGEHQDILFICMEYVAGGSLSSFLAKNNLEVRDAIEMLRDISSAIEHAHSNKVLHRDLKPSNVLLTPERRPKIGDFGLAKLIDDVDDLTQTGAVMGTPAYMAPEQAEGRLKDIDERTDIWALGVILYESLTRHLPFFASDRNKIMELLRKQTPSPPSSLNSDVPPELDAICLKCLEKRPENRYQTATELAAELQNWLDGKGTLASGAAKRSKTRTRRKVAVASLLLIAVLATSIVLLSNSKQNAPDKNNLPPAFVAGTWHPLLTKEPDKLIWPDGARMNWNPDKKELTLSSAELTLASLGQSNAARYELSISIRQTPMVGHVGLYFGYGDLRADSRLSYQVIELASTPDPKSGTPRLRLDWKTVSNNGGLTVRSAFIVDHSPREHVLKIAVGPSGLERVNWDNETFPNFDASILETPIPPEESRGGFGIYVNNGAGIFRDVRYRIEEP